VATLSTNSAGAAGETAEWALYLIIRRTLSYIARSMASSVPRPGFPWSNSSATAIWPSTTSSGQRLGVLGGRALPAVLAGRSRGPVTEQVQTALK
jgi:hypothetical protein